MVKCLRILQVAVAAPLSERSFELKHHVRCPSSPLEPVALFEGNAKPEHFLSSSSCTAFAIAGFGRCVAYRYSKEQHTKVRAIFDHPKNPTQSAHAQIFLAPLVGRQLSVLLLSLTSAKQFRQCW